jgi:hypothetical protein
MAMVQKKEKVAANPSLAQQLGSPHRSERRERRSPLAVLLRVCGFSAGGRIFSELASTRNISRSGCCVRLRTRPLGHAALAVQVIPSEGPWLEGSTQMLYQIAWLEQREHGWDVGLFAMTDTDLLRVAFASHTP